MNAKTTVILLVLLILGLLFVAYYYTDLLHPRAVPTAQESTAVLPELAAVRKVTLQRQGQEPIVLALRDGKWRMLEPMDAPAAHGDVERLLNALTTLHYETRYTPDSPDRPKDDLTFLSTPDQKVTLTAAGCQEVIVRIGHQKPLSDLSYVQVEGDNNIYVALVDLSHLIPSSAQDLRNHDVVEAPLDEITHVAFSGAGELELAKQDRLWQILRPVKARADQEKVANLLRNLTGLKADKFVSDNPTPAQLETFGLANPSVTITVDWAGPGKAAASQPATSSAPAASSPASAPAGQSATVAFGAATAGNIYGRLAGQKGVFQTSQAKVDELVAKLTGLRDQRVLNLPDVGQFTHIDIKLSAAPSATLEKVNGYWQMAAPFPGPADQDSVTWLLTTMRDLRAAEYVETATPAGLGLAPPVGEITLSNAAGDKKVTLRIGRATGESGQTAYVQAADNSSVAVVPAAEYAILNRPAAAYWPKQLFSLPQNAQITKIEVQKPDGKIVLEGAPGKPGDFRLTSPINAPADSGFVGPVMELARNITAGKVVALDKGVPKRLTDLKPIRLNVSFDVPVANAPGVRAASAPGVQHGNAPAIYLAKDAGKSYVWIGGMLPVAVGEMDGSVFDNVNAEPRDRHVFNIPPAKAVGFRMALGKSGMEFTRSGNQWRYTSDRFVKIDSEGLDRFLTELASLRVARFADYGDKPDLKRFGLDQPAMVITVSYDDGRSDTLNISRTGPVGTPGLYANSSLVPGVFVLGPEESIKMRETVQGLRKEKNDNDTQPPPTPPAMMPGAAE